VGEGFGTLRMCGEKSTPFEFGFLAFSLLLECQSFLPKNRN